MLHTLTEKIRAHQHGGFTLWLEIDSIIRAYLGEKATELRAKWLKGDCTISQCAYAVAEILGLSSQQEPEPIAYSCTKHNVGGMGYVGCPRCQYEKETQEPKPKTAQEWWCDHITISHMQQPHKRWMIYTPTDYGVSEWVDIGNNWVECPICGTPKPEVKSLSEVILGELKRQGIDLKHMEFMVDEVALEKAVTNFNSTKEHS